MPETKEITVYTFDELSDKAKEHAIEQYARHGMDWEWWDTVYDDAKEDGKEHGFDINDIRFSGFWSQGDGASWTGLVNISKFMEKHINADHPLFARAQVYAILIQDGWIDNVLEIRRSSYHYSHSHTMSVGEIDDGALASVVHHEPHDGEQHVEFDCPLKGASVRELANGINAEDFARELMDAVLEKAKDYADDIYKELEKQYEWYVSEECVADTAEANEWRFDEKGDIV